MKPKTGSANFANQTSAGYQEPLFSAAATSFVSTAWSAEPPAAPPRIWVIRSSYPVQPKYPAIQLSRRDSATRYWRKPYLRRGLARAIRAHALVVIRTRIRCRADASRAGGPVVNERFIGGQSQARKINSASISTETPRLTLTPSDASLRLPTTRLLP